MWKVNDEGVMEYAYEAVFGATSATTAVDIPVDVIYTKPETEEEKQIRYWRALQDAARG